MTESLHCDTDYLSSVSSRPSQEIVLISSFLLAQAILREEKSLHAGFEMMDLRVEGADLYLDAELRNMALVFENFIGICDGGSSR